MEVTRDKYELPVAVADSCRELAEIRGTTVNAISSAISHCKNGTNQRKQCKYIKVDIEEQEAAWED